MTTRHARIRWMGVLWLLCVAWPALAQEGQPDLDAAMDRKVTAESLQDLAQVAALCEKALEKGLAKDDEAIARKLLTGALYERAKQMCRPVTLGVPVAGPQLKELRERVLPDLEKILKYNAQFGQAHLLIAQLQSLEGGDAQQARKSVDQAIESLADNHERLAEALLLRSGLQSAPADALADLDRAVELAPDDPGVWQARAMHYLEQGEAKYDDAIKDLDEAAKLDPADLGLTLRRAQVHYAAEHNELAYQDIQRVLEARPDVLPAIELRSSILAALGKYAEAAQDVRQLLEKEPDNILLKLQWAIYLNAGNQSRKAIEVFGDVLRADPQNGVALRGRADACLNVGEHRKAVDDYEVVVKMFADDSGILNNFAWVLATSPEDDIRNGKRALEMGLKACELTEYGQAHILSTLAAAYAETGDFENAVKWSQKSVDLGDKEIQEQLKQELENYRQRKPWREKKAEPATEPAKPDTAQVVR